MQTTHCHDVSALAVATTGLHAVPAPTCGLASGLHCTLPLDGSTKSIKLHLRKHGHWHSQRRVVQCPWTGCPAILRWMNIPRHIQSIHLGVRFRCFNCGKAYTRPEGLAVHTASLKCYGNAYFCVERKHSPLHSLQALL
ncbi:hypothetical protein JVT61DRAFT_608 [Boletus reticuloceps]|uniref:C2H2-type domain-containing protein n=1 Tax=Boletus reticuloceps TaxID=495285 RepID=A0A8I3AGV5_9AGAM|nr:hypothetical protein JVT61DRAFT_608 [Boletus reticuloceps]